MEEITQSAVDSLTDDVAANIADFNIFKDYFQGKVPGTLDFVLKTVMVVAIFLICRKLIKFFMKILGRSFERAGMEAASANFTISVIQAVMYVVLVAVLATSLGVDAASIAALLGSMGVGIVLALKESLSNIAGGVILLFMKPFVSGDYIREDSNGNEGTVVKIDLFYTTLLTVDNQTVCIPNGILSNSSLTNISKQDKRQLREKVGISYRANIGQAKKVLEDILHAEDSILKDQPINVVVEQLGDHAVILAWHAWVRPSEYHPTRWRLTEKIKNAFDEQGIEIPYNQLDVHINNMMPGSKA